MAALSSLGTSGRVLLCDDSPIALEAIGSRLQESGLDVVMTQSPREALGLATEGPQPFDLLILDVMMPGLDGPEVCRRLRADPRTQTVPIVLVTALPPATLAVQLRGCPYDELLPKPFAIEAVLAIAERYAGPPITPA